MQFVDEWCHSHHFAKRDGVNPDDRLVRLMWLVLFKYTQPLKESRTAPWLSQQDPDEDRGHEQQHDVVEETPHKLSAVSHQHTLLAELTADG